MVWEYRGHPISMKVVINFIEQKLGHKVTEYHMRGITHWLTVGPEQFRRDRAVSAKYKNTLREVQVWMAMFTLRLKPIRGEKKDDDDNRDPRPGSAA